MYPQVQLSPLLPGTYYRQEAAWVMSDALQATRSLIDGGIISLEVAWVSYEDGSDRWRRVAGEHGQEGIRQREEVSRDQLRAHVLLVSVAADVLDATLAMIKKKRAELDFWSEMIIPGPDGKLDGMTFLRGLYAGSIVVPVDQLRDAAKVIDLLLEQEEIRERLDRGGCLRCGRRLPRGKRKYCSRRCSNSFLQQQHRSKRAIEVIERDRLRLEIAGPGPLIVHTKHNK